MLTVSALDYSTSYFTMMTRGHIMQHSRPSMAYLPILCRATVNAAGFTHTQNALLVPARQQQAVTQF